MRALLVVVLLSMPVPAIGFDHSHATFGEVLDARVEDAKVDYAGLKAAPGKLRRYLRLVAAVSRSDFEGWSEAQQIAFLTNLYNAATLDLILRHYPVDSIKDIGGIFSGPWKQEVVQLWGETVTLDHVEHGLLRKNYREPRVHFALVCAAMGCPPLREQPFVAERLGEQLDDQGRRFLANRAKNRIDPSKRTVFVSPIFKWFSEDFGVSDGEVLAFVKPYFPAAEQAKLERDFYLAYTHYDWSLNDAGAK